MNRLRELLATANASGRALGSFTCYNLEGVQAVAAAAEAAAAPAVVLLAAAAFRRPDGKRLTGALVAATRIAATQVIVELDHESDMEVIRQAVELGVEAAMVDGSRLPTADNAALVFRARFELGEGTGIEAELGRVEGEEDIDLGSVLGALTDPDEVIDFVERSGCDCLAVSIGNVHGTYRRPPQLDTDRLRALAAASRIPLSLHGASGLSRDELRRVIASGIRKVNFNTELRRELFRALTHSVHSRSPGLDVLGLVEDVTIAMQAVVSEKLQWLGWE